MYNPIVTRRVRADFDRVNAHDYDGVAADLAPDVHHHFAGDHALGGERHDSAAVRRWLGRLGRVMPDLRVTLTDVRVTGWPWASTVYARWDGAATLDDGSHYRNHGLHVIRLRGSRVVDIDVYEDSQAVAEVLQHQAGAGIAEALAEPIRS